MPTAKNDATERVASDIADLLLRVDALPNQDSRPENEILGYGEGGTGIRSLLALSYSATPTA
jgi:hypothetical protein